MAHYWLPDVTSGTGTGNWSATGATGHWADDAIGTNLGKAAPGAGDNVFFGAAAFNGAGQTVTIDATANCLDMDWTGATNTPTFALSENIYHYGSLTFIGAMTFTPSIRTSYFLPVGAATLTSAGKTFRRPYKLGVGSLQLIDGLTVSNSIICETGDLDLNGQTVTTPRFSLAGAGAMTFTMGAATINTTGTGFSNVASTLTITANTATINVAGTGEVTLGDANYNGADFNLNGTAHTVSGSPTGIAELNFKPVGIQTITATGATLPFISMIRTGAGVITIVNGTFTQVLGRVVLHHMSISGSTANGGASFYAGSTSTDGGGNAGWVFREPVGAYK